MLIYGRNQHNIIKQLFSNKIFFKFEKDFFNGILNLHFMFVLGVSFLESSWITNKASKHSLSYFWFYLWCDHVHYNLKEEKKILFWASINFLYVFWGPTWNPRVSIKILSWRHLRLNRCKKKKKKPLQASLIWLKATMSENWGYHKSPGMGQGSFVALKKMERPLISVQTNITQTYLPSLLKIHVSSLKRSNFSFLPFPY